MAVKKWHFGKLVILWAWGAALSVVLFKLTEILAKSISKGQAIVDSAQSRVATVTGTGLSAAIVAVLITLSVLTWIWLGGKEK